ncbi:MAG: hypothetical protein MJZ01_06580 [Bacteroidales bacterium]|nr:hypothetical protein [Bacteroidales bacterium]
MQRFSCRPHRNENGVLLFTDEFDNTKLRTDIDSVELTDEEYAGLKSEINSNYSKHKSSKISIEHFSPNGENSIFAVFENYGFNKYRFIHAGEYSYEDVDAYEEFAKRFNRRLANGQKNISENVLDDVLDSARTESGFGYIPRMGYVEDKSNDVLRNDENDIIKQETDRLSDSGIDNKGDKKGKGNELSQPRFSFTHETDDQRKAREAIDEWIAREVQPIIDRNSEREAKEPKSSAKEILGTIASKKDWGEEG